MSGDRWRKDECLRCGHDWHRRSPERPVVCPKCHTPYWDKEKKQKKQPLKA